MPEEAWPVTSDDYSTEVKFLCYSVKKQGHTHEISVLLPRQAFMAQGPGMKTAYCSFWHRLDFDVGHVEKPHNLYLNPIGKGWNHFEIRQAWQEAKQIAGWETMDGELRKRLESAEILETETNDWEVVDWQAVNWEVVDEVFIQTSNIA